MLVVKILILKGETTVWLFKFIISAVTMLENEPSITSHVLLQQMEFIQRQSRRCSLGTKRIFHPRIPFNFDVGKQS